MTATGELNLGHILAVYGIDPADVLVLRHTSTNEGLAIESVTDAEVLEYTRTQSHGNKVGATPPKLWLVFLADGKRRSRFFGAYENGGEAVSERDESHRYFDLRQSEFLGLMRGRLVIEWSKDAVNWAKSGARAAAFSVVEIADRDRATFPGFDDVLIAFDVLKQVADEDDSRYVEWRAALSSVQGIYLITDKSTGKFYVGKADGGDRILGRWRAYAHDGHAGNVALKQLHGLDPDHKRHFIFSILRVFSPTTPRETVDRAESHYKNALGTRSHGLNRN